MSFWVRGNEFLGFGNEFHDFGNEFPHFGGNEFRPKRTKKSLNVQMWLMAQMKAYTMPMKKCTLFSPSQTIFQNSDVYLLNEI